MQKRAMKDILIIKNKIQNENENENDKTISKIGRKLHIHCLCSQHLHGQYHKIITIFVPFFPFK